MKKGLLCWLFCSGLISSLVAQVRPASDVFASRFKVAGFHIRPVAPGNGTPFYENFNKSFLGAPLFVKILLISPPVSPPAKENLLPPWSPTDLPFFCRIEHDCGKILPFAFKFRLGSVEYVDQLEGKTRWMGQ